MSAGLKAIRIIKTISVAAFVVTFILTSFVPLRDGRFYGLAVDGDGRLYIGREGGIEVCADGKRERTIPVQDGIYSFTLSSGEILLRSAGKSAVMGLDGSVLHRAVTPEEEALIPSGQNTVCTGADGSVYELRAAMPLRKYIRKTSGGSVEVVYRQPLTEYLISLAKLASLVLAALSQIVESVLLKRSGVKSYDPPPGNPLIMGR